MAINLNKFMNIINIFRCLFHWMRNASKCFETIRFRKVFCLHLSGWQLELVERLLK